MDFMTDFKHTVCYIRQYHIQSLNFMASKVGMMGKVQKWTAGFALMESIIIVLVAIAILLIGYVIIRNTDSGSTGTPTVIADSTTDMSTGPYAIQSPATVPSKIAECNQQVIFSSDGNSSPIMCANGDLNIAEWSALGAFESKVMTLGYAATFSQVQSALCSDVQVNISNPIEETIYKISSLYYGWDFTSDPSAVLANGTCVNVDD